MSVIEQWTQLEVLICSECGVSFGMPTHYVQTRRERGGVFHCPNGHQQVFLETEVQKLQKKLAQERQARDQVEARLRDEVLGHRATVGQLRAAKGQLTKQTKRHAAGVCPCCKRTFQQLVRHMKTKHPDFKAEDRSNG